MSASAASTLFGCQAQPGGAQCPHEFTAVDLDGAGIDHDGAVALGDVIVITLERPTLNPMDLDEGVQFLQ